MTEMKYKKSSVSDVEYYGHLWNSGQLAGSEGASKLVVDMLPVSNPGYYKRDGNTGQGIIYKEDSATGLHVDTLEKNGGSNIFIRKSTAKENIQPSLCPKTHCPASFQYSLG